MTDAATGLTYAQQRYYDPILGRFLSVDPVLPNDNGGSFNRYWYANNNPYKFSDPDGRYRCKASFNDCTTVNWLVSGIGEAMKGLDPRSQDYQRLDATARYFGKPGEKNGVTIQVKKLGKDVLAEKTPNGGRIYVDVAKVANLPAGYYTANPNKSAAQIQVAVGAGAIAHEVKHGMDNDAHGPPSGRPSEYGRELDAYRTQAAVGAGLNINIGLSTKTTIEDAAKSSTDNWCKGKAACR